MKRTKKNILLGFVLSLLTLLGLAFGLVTIVLGMVIGLIARAVHRTFDTAVIVTAAYYTLKLLKVT